MSNDLREAFQCDDDDDEEAHPAALFGDVTAQHDVGTNTTAGSVGLGHVDHERRQIVESLKDEEERHQTKSVWTFLSRRSCSTAFICV